jgi:hypothetical protein
MGSFWSHLISTIAGGVIAIAGGFFPKLYSDLQERRALRSAHAGELRANLDFLREFDRIARLRNLISTLEAQPYPPQFFGVQPGKYEYNKVFTSTASKLGMLASPLPERIVRAHYELQLMFEILENNTSMSRDPLALTVDQEENLQRHRDLLQRMQTFCDSTAALIDDLEGY